MKEAVPPPVGAFHYRRHAPRLPRLQEGVELRRHPVLIAGGGPVGLALARSVWLTWRPADSMPIASRI